MDHDSELTNRQFTFLKALADLVVETRAPVHYTRVAESLGVNRFSAYDMLRTLEAKKLVATDYVLGTTGGGPGRSRVVFYPTRQAIALLRERTASARQAVPAELDESAAGQEEWLSFRQSILRRLQESRLAGKRELLQDLLSRLPERNQPLHYCAQMITALILNLSRVQDRMAAISPFEVLAALTSEEEGAIRALAGLSLGSALVVDDHSDPSVSQQLVAHMQGFQHNLHALSSEGKTRLRLFLWEAIRTIEPASTAPATSTLE